MIEAMGRRGLRGVDERVGAATSIKELGRSDTPKGGSASGSIRSVSTEDEAVERGKLLAGFRHEEA